MKSISISLSFGDHDGLQIMSDPIQLVKRIVEQDDQITAK